jgi:hypothetical protein
MIEALWRRSRALWLKRQWQSLLLIGTTTLSLGFLGLGLIRGWRELLRYRWQFDWLPLGLSGATYSVALALAVLAWVVIMRALHAGSTWRQDAKFFLYSWIARRLPTPAPYFASRVLLYERIGVPKRLTGVGLIWENILLVVSGAMLVLLLLPLTPVLSTRIGPAPMLLAAAGLLLVVRPIWLTQAANWVLRRMGKAPLTISISPTAALLALVVYTAIWLTGGVILFFLIRSLYPIDWAILPLIVQSWVFSGLVSYLVFFLPIGFGIRELTLAALLSLVIPLSVAVVIVILARIWVMANELLWALIFSKL